MEDFVLYFGCNEQAGHFLIGPRGSVRDFEADKMMVPHAGSLDGTFIFLPRPEKVGNGALTYLPATDRTVLAWWGSPWDSRGAVNSAIILSGRVETAEDCWARFTKAFPRLAPKLTMPTVRHAHAPTAAQPEALAAEAAEQTPPRLAAK